MDWIDDESTRLKSPLLADELVGCEALECLQSSPEIVGVDEVGKMLFQLCVIVVVEALDGSFLDGPVHSLDLSVSPGVLHLGQAMLDAVIVADPVEDVLEGISITSSIGELNAIIGQFDGLCVGCKLCGCFGRDHKKMNSGRDEIEACLRLGGHLCNKGACSLGYSLPSRRVIYQR